MGIVILYINPPKMFQWVEKGQGDKSYLTNKK